MVIEDDIHILDAIVSTLESEGYSCFTARNGECALKILRERGTMPGLIILDLMMPVMSGWEFRKVQLNDERLREIPIVVLTAWGQCRTSHEIQEPAAFLHKPIEREALLGTVNLCYAEADAGARV
jgi:CheY-like chemotaxis protein